MWYRARLGERGFITTERGSIMYDFMLEYTGEHRVYPPMSVIKCLNDRWYLSDKLKRHCLPHVKVCLHGDWSSVGERGVLQLNEMMETSDSYTGEEKTWFKERALQSLVGKARYRSGRTSGVIFIRRNERRQWEAKTFDGAECEVPSAASLVELEPCIPVQLFVEYRYFFRVMKYNKLTWQMLCRLKMSADPCEDGNTVEILTPQERGVQGKFCDLVMRDLVDVVMPIGKPPVFVFQLDVFVVDIGGKERVWLNNVSILPLCTVGMSNYSASINGLLGLCQSVYQFVQRHVTGNGEDTFVSWPC